jgi:hypothetical protein
MAFTEDPASMWNVWENSLLRKWLNGNFFDTAFTLEQKLSVREKFVPNDFNTYYEQEMSSNGVSYDANPGIDTFDKVFLLSAGEAAKYFKVKSGTVSDINTIVWDYSGDERLKCIGTEYAFNNGLLLGTSRHIEWPDYNHLYSSTIFGNWWLRSVGKKMTTRNREYNYSSYVTYQGKLSVSGESPDFAAYGVRPAIWVNVKEAVYNTYDAIPEIKTEAVIEPVPETLTETEAVNETAAEEGSEAEDGSDTGSDTAEETEPETVTDTAAETENDTTEDK